LTLLATAWPQHSLQDWADASIGERDEHLLTLREELFGTALESVAKCPRCEEQIEIAFATADIRVHAPDVGDEVRVSAAGYDVRCRVPNSADLLALGEAGESDPKQQLLARCVRRARRGNNDVDAAVLPDTAVRAITQAMAKADPQADVHIGLSCPACQHRWSLPFDILAYVWEEIEDWAQRLLYEIHALAAAYGWREPDILALSARRRQLYLDMIHV